VLSTEVKWQHWETFLSEALGKGVFKAYNYITISLWGKLLPPLRLGERKQAHFVKLRRFPANTSLTLSPHPLQGVQDRDDGQHRTKPRSTRSK
jgi:hypothetical protein